MEIILIGDARIKAVPVQDNGETLVDLAKEFPRLTFDFERRFVQKKSKSISFARRKIGELLLQVKENLPANTNLLVKECYRPLWIQKQSFDSYCSYLRQKFPEWNEGQVYLECSKLNAPIDVAPHSTGGAVDLTLTTDRGDWFDMGTDMNADPLETNYATFMKAKNISETARKNREVLSQAMKAVGFVNYPTEWWHWSYGDKYWAFLTKAQHAIYSSFENFPE